MPTSMLVKNENGMFIKLEDLINYMNSKKCDAYWLDGSQTLDMLITVFEGLEKERALEKKEK